MAIDFPSNPVEGTTYDFGGTRYTFTLVGGAPGYWTIKEPGLIGPATSVEIDAGVNSSKYATPFAMEGSKYLDKNIVGVNGSAGNSVLRGEKIGFLAGLGLTLGQVASDITVAAKAATSSIAGVMKVFDSVTSTETQHAASANAVKVTYDIAVQGSWTESNESSPGWIREGTNRGEMLASDGLIQMWGSVNIPIGTVGQQYAIVFPRRFLVPPHGVQVTCSSNAGGLLQVNGTSTTGFNAIRLTTQAVTLMWFAYGRDVAQ